MRYTASTLEQMQQRAAIDGAKAKGITDEQMKDAPKPFGQYITVRQFCELTSASPGAVYYSIREAPASMDAIKHGLWFIHIDIAIDYADTLKARRLKRASQLAKAALRVEKRNARRLKKAEAVSASLDKKEQRAAKTIELHPVTPDEHGRITITQVGEMLGVPLSTASMFVQRKEIPRVREGRHVTVPYDVVKEKARERIAAD